MIFCPWAPYHLIAPAGYYWDFRFRHSMDRNCDDGARMWKKWIGKKEHFQVMASICTITQQIPVECWISRLIKSFYICCVGRKISWALKNGLCIFGAVGIFKIAFHQMHSLSNVFPESCVLIIIGIILGLVNHFSGILAFQLQGKARGIYRRLTEFGQG